MSVFKSAICKMISSPPKSAVLGKVAISARASLTFSSPSLRASHGPRPQLGGDIPPGRPPPPDPRLWAGRAGRAATAGKPAGLPEPPRQALIPLGPPAALHSHPPHPAHRLGHLLDE